MVLRTVHLQVPLEHTGLQLAKGSPADASWASRPLHWQNEQLLGKVTSADACACKLMVACVPANATPPLALLSLTEICAVLHTLRTPVNRSEAHNDCNIHVPASLPPHAI